jgi:hypothetical protein
VAVVAAAHELCTLLLEDGEREEAECSAYRGLRSDEVSYVLCEDLMHATAADRPHFDRVWTWRR